MYEPQPADRIVYVFGTSAASECSFGRLTAMPDNLSSFIKNSAILVNRYVFAGQKQVIQEPLLFNATMAPGEWPFSAGVEEMLADDQAWDQLFASESSMRLLDRLAAEAIAEDEAGLTAPLEELLAEDEAATNAVKANRAVPRAIQVTSC